MHEVGYIFIEGVRRSNTDIVSLSYVTLASEFMHIHNNHYKLLPIHPLNVLIR